MACVVCYAGLLGSVWHGCSRFGACLLVLGSCSWVEELGLVVCVACARDVAFWFYLVVLFGVMLVWVVGCIGFAYDVLSGGFVSGCCPLPMVLGEVLPVFHFY